MPQDIALVHQVRSLIQEVATREALLMSLIDFVEPFGANTREIMVEVDLSPRPEGCRGSWCRSEW